MECEIYYPGVEEQSGIGMEFWRDSQNLSSTVRRLYSTPDLQPGISTLRWYYYTRVEKCKHFRTDCTLLSGTGMEGLQNSRNRCLGLRILPGWIPWGYTRNRTQQNQSWIPCIIARTPSSMWIVHWYKGAYCSLYFVLSNVLALHYWFDLTIILGTTASGAYCVTVLWRER